MLSRRLLTQAGSAPGILAALTSLCAFLVYLFTLAPTITWRNDGADGGDFLAAIATGGVPHPSGYPTYLLLGSLFARLPISDAAAYRLNLMSAAAAAGAVAALSFTLHGALSSAVRTAGRQAPVWLDALVVANVVLTFGFSSILWSQAVITEVYTLNALFVVLIWLAALRARWTGRPWLWGMCGLLLGLGLGNHLSLATVLPGLLVLLCPNRRIQLAGHSSPAGAQRRRLSFGPSLALMTTFVVGLTVYAVLPLRASQCPPINWGGADSWSGFLWLVSGRLYAPLAFGLPLGYLPGRVLAGLALLARQVAWWGLPLVMLGAWLMWRRDRQLALSLLAALATAFVYAVGYGTSDSYVYLLPAVVVLTIWMSWGLYDVLSALHARAKAAESVYRQTTWRVAGALGLCLAALAPGLPLAANYGTVDASHDQEAHRFGRAALESAAPQALIVTEGTRDTFTLWYFRYATTQRSDVVVVSGPLLPYAWYTQSLAKHHPDLVLPAGSSDATAMVKELIRNNLPRRPVYLTSPNWPLPPQFRLEAQGTLHKVVIR